MNGELLPGNFWVKYPADDSEALHRLRLSEYLTNLSGEGAAAEQWALLEPAPADAPAREEGTHRRVLPWCQEALRARSCDEEDR